MSKCLSKKAKRLILVNLIFRGTSDIEANALECAKEMDATSETRPLAIGLVYEFIMHVKVEPWLFEKNYIDVRRVEGGTIRFDVVEAFYFVKEGVIVLFVEYQRVEGLRKVERIIEEKVWLRQKN